MTVTGYLPGVVVAGTIHFQVALPLPLAVFRPRPGRLTLPFW